jgi:hypothetical protein
MGFLALITILILVLVAAAFVKYIFFR